MSRASEITHNLNESSLSRVWNHVTKHDSGTISAFRYAKDCGNGEVFSKKENMNRNAILRAKLLNDGYGVTPIKGVHIENYNSDNEIEVAEHSFLVVDLKDVGNLKKDLIKFGSKFEQDSITYSKMNGDYYVIGTNNCSKSYPGFKKEIKLGKSLFGKKGTFHSKINGRPFVFENLNMNVIKLSDLSIPEIRSVKNLCELL